MSHPHLAPRRVAIPALVSLAIVLGCASGGPPRPPAPAAPLTSGDTATVRVEGGKSIENIFAGRFPGVTVTQSDAGGLRIVIQGRHSFCGNDDPLYVVDDTPLPIASGGILFLNPYDIEKIEVLKSPSDLALYGVRGGNGVVKITTRRAHGS